MVQLKEGRLWYFVLSRTQVDCKDQQVRSGSIRSHHSNKLHILYMYNIYNNIFHYTVSSGIKKYISYNELNTLCNDSTKGIKKFQCALAVSQDVISSVS